MKPYIPYLIPVSIKGVVIENNKVWLRKNERNEWELPGGKIDKGEQPVETIIRELKEELGFDVEIVEILQSYLYTIKISIDESKGVLVVTYLCNLKSKTGEFELIGEAGEAKFAQFSNKEVQDLNMPEFYKDSINKAFNSKYSPQ